MSCFEFNDNGSPFGLPLLPELIGTKYRHQGRDPVRGLDCLGLIMVAAKRLFNVKIRELVDYPQDWATTGFDFYEKYWDQVFDTQEVITPGTIMLFQFGSKTANHAGVYAGRRLVIHSYNKVGVIYTRVCRFKKFFKVAGKPLTKQPVVLV